MSCIFHLCCDFVKWANDGAFFLLMPFPRRSGVCHSRTIHNHIWLAGWCVVREAFLPLQTPCLNFFLISLCVFLNRVKVEPGFVPLLQVEGNFFNTGDLWKINQKQIFCENCVVMTNTSLWSGVRWGETVLCFSGRCLITAQGATLQRNEIPLEDYVFVKQRELYQCMRLCEWKSSF